MVTSEQEFQQYWTQWKAQTDANINMVRALEAHPLITARYIGVAYSSTK